jgi:tryptophan 2,3-dioxygenase
MTRSDHVDYQSYLCLDTLLSLQRPRVPVEESDRVRSAEQFFIVVHQASELWVAQLLLDLDLAALALRHDDPATAAEHLERAADVFGVLRAQIDVLDRLPVACFTRFRPYLGTASGAQSRQFAELERTLGLGPDPSSLTTALEEAVTANGTTLAEVCRSDGPLRRVVTAMSTIARRHRAWKTAHLAVASRMLADRPGTGGTSGTRYLAGRVRLPFPELHAAHREADQPVPAGHTPGVA